jgi:hypothetical protein
MSLPSVCVLLHICVHVHVNVFALSVSIPMSVFVSLFIFIFMVILIFIFIIIFYHIHFYVHFHDCSSCIFRYLRHYIIHPKICKICLAATWFARFFQLVQTKPTVVHMLKKPVLYFSGDVVFLSFKNKSCRPYNLSVRIF